MTPLQRIMAPMLSLCLAACTTVPGAMTHNTQRVPANPPEFNAHATSGAPEAAAAAADAATADASPAGPEVGRRDRDEFDKIVTLYVAARAGQTLRGPDIVVAAEKAGLSYGYMNIFHRLGDGRSEGSPIFSVANIKKPGSFEMHEIQAMETPAIAFFLTLPAPIPALDAWEKMLPTAQRMAELVDAEWIDVCQEVETEPC